MDWLKIIASSLGLVEFWSKYFGDKKLQETGAKLQQGATDAATLQKISDVSRPVTGAESDELWNKNSKRFGQPDITGEWIGE